jgi:hypothetical protein
LDFTTFSGEITTILQEGLPMGIINLTEPDANQTHTFEILPVMDAELFDIESPSGNLKLMEPYVLKPQGMNNLKIRVKVTENTPEAYTDIALIQVRVQIDEDFLNTLLNVEEDELLVAVDMQSRVYPNPARESIKLEVNNTGNTPLIVSLINLHGKIIRKFEIENPENNFISNIDLTGLQKGTYVISVQSSSGMTKNKFIKL